MEKKEGEYKEWHNNGKLFLECFYLNYKLEGEYKAWSEEGVLIAHRIYEKEVKNIEPILNVETVVEVRRIV
jgi:antitoxin component YwqK of YwqJK toxin-antitoxin module